MNKKVKTYLGVDTNSDHKLLVAELRVKWKKLNKTQPNDKAKCKKANHG